MSVSRLTALEIYGNQDDIVCECWGKNDDGLFIGVIRRGPGHNNKLLLDIGFTVGGLKVDSKEEAVSHMESLRDSIIGAIEEELANEESQTSKLLKNDSVQVALEVAKMAREKD